MDEVVVSGRHFSGLHTRILLDHVLDRLGDAGVSELLSRAGETRPLEVLRDDSSWSSYGQLRSLLEIAQGLLAEAGGLDGVAEMSLGGITGPEFARAMQAFGSPLAMMLAAGSAGDAVSPVQQVRTEAAGPTRVRSHRQLREGFEPFPELCSFLAAVLPLGVRLFGLRVLEIRETSCQCRGDGECVVELAWDEAEDLALQLDAQRTRAELAETRLEGYQRTVTDIVSAESLDTVLGRIVASTAQAVSAPGFVLAVEALAGGARLYTEGVTVEAAERFLAEEHDCLSAEVASAHRRYGRLVVVAPRSSTGFAEGSLDAYARLAAAALDSAYALEDARRQAQTAEALLQLSTALAELSSVGELAAKLARAIPDVIDCDAAAVLFITDGMARVAAHYGFPPDVESQLAELEFPAGRLAAARVTGFTRDELSPMGRDVMDAAGLKATACAPLHVDDETIGLLIAGVRHDSGRILEDSKLAERFAGLSGQATVALRNNRLLDQIRHQSLHDSLTELPNRALILDRAEQMLARARRDQIPAATLFIDLDGFKEINDTLGHPAGDELLQQVAARLKKVLRANDTVGRLGGDEFVVLCEGASLDAGVEVVAERLLEILHEPYQLSFRDRPVTVGASIGVATGDYHTAGDLLRDADIALYQAKASGKGCQRIFAPEMKEQLLARAELGERLADAVANKEFFLVYQPIFDLRTETATGVEALLRWNHPKLGVVPPVKFIPLLEETGLIIEVGRWVLREACRQINEVRAAGHDLHISVNASARQLERPDYVDDVRLALDESGIPPSSLTIEITETAIMRDTDAAVLVLNDLKRIGVRIAIDDFGTGYSSLAYLRQFPVDSLKIDRSFIESVIDSPEASELIRTVVDLGRSLRLETLAEGIEHNSQLQRLQHEGCDSGQGFLFAKPLNPEALITFLQQQQLVAVGHA